MNVQQKMNEAAVAYIKAKGEFIRKVTPKYILVNPNYLNEFMNGENINNIMIENGVCFVDYEGVIPFEEVPVIINKETPQYQFVYEEGGNNS